MTLDEVRNLKVGMRVLYSHSSAGTVCAVGSTIKILWDHTKCLCNYGLFETTLWSHTAVLSVPNPLLWAGWEGEV